MSAASGLSDGLLELVVPPEWSGQRIDTTLAALLRNHSARRVQRWVKSGNVRLNLRTAAPDSRVMAGDLIAVRLIDPPDMVAPTAAGVVDWLLDDHWCGLVDKPAGLVVHPTGPHQDDTLLNRLQRVADERTGVRGLLRPGIVHRLDAETSGVIAIAWDGIAHRRLQQQFERGEARKSYLALVEGSVRDDGGRIARPIGHAPGRQRTLMSCQSDAEHPRTAVTDYRTLYRWPDGSLVRCQPLTGRNHQIRVHLASIGHPLVADRFYGTAGTLRTERSLCSLGLLRHALHAERLRLRHPVTGCVIDRVAPIPSDFAAAIRRLSDRP